MRKLSFCLELSLLKVDLTLTRANLKLSQADPTTFLSAEACNYRCNVSPSFYTRGQTTALTMEAP